MLIRLQGGECRRNSLACSEMSIQSGAKSERSALSGSEPFVVACIPAFNEEKAIGGVAGQGVEPRARAIGLKVIF